MQFYVRGVRAPYELVVMEVTKNGVNGYLTTPKEAGGREPSGASAGSPSAAAAPASAPAAANAPAGPPHLQ
jgi:hypothetical protein